MGILIVLCFGCFHGLYYLAGPFIGIAVMDNKNRVNNAWYPEKEAKNDVEQKLNRLAAQQHSQRRQDNGNNVKHTNSFKNHRANRDAFYALISVVQTKKPSESAGQVEKLWLSLQGKNDVRDSTGGCRRAWRRLLHRAAVEHMDF
ncbi:MAG TPA: hypothetical protein VLH60_07175 [Sedimentisphaerales bacterium]|nr:hypothetical protein [Sedimentisphaerales bacterium]